KPGLLQQQKGPAAVGGVVGNGHRRAAAQLVQAADALAVQAHGLDVHAHQHGQVQPVIRRERLQIRNVLEVVGVQLAVGQRQVGQHVVRELHDAQLDAVGLQDGLDEL